MGGKEGTYRTEKKRKIHEEGKKVGFIELGHLF